MKKIISIQCKIDQ